MRFLKNIVKEKLQKQQKVVGSWLNLPSIEVAEIMAKVGFDFLVIDTEHSAIDERTMQQMIQVIEGYAVAPFVRVAENHPVPIKKALDAGAYGIIVPMVSTPEEATKAIQSVYYPGKGKRGVGLSRAQNYGLGMETYKKWYQENMVLVVQIEHRDALPNLEAIASMDDIDATMIGPYDLSGSFGFPGEYHREEIQEALQQYETISQKCRKPYGFHLVQPEIDVFKKRLEQGYTFIAYGIDEILFGRKCLEESEKIQEALDSFLLPQAFDKEATITQSKQS